MLVAILCAAFAGQAWGDETTYTFTSKSWAATSGGDAANWTSGKDGAALTSGRGIQVTTGATGANGTSPVSFTNVTKVVVTYSTNASKGAGSIEVKIGTNSKYTHTITSTGGTTDRTEEFNISPSAESGNVKITVNCTTNSIYIKSVAITHAAPSSGAETVTTIDASGITNKNIFEGTAAGSLSASVTYGTPASSVPEASVIWSGDNDAVATINASTGVVTLVGAGTVNFTATYAGVTGTYLSSSDTYEMTVTDEDPDIVTIWNEDFSGYSADDVPSGGTYGYVCVNGNSDTKIYENASAGGTSPELLINKKGTNNGSFSATIPLNHGYAGTLKLLFKNNQTINVSVTDNDDNVLKESTAILANTTTGNTVDITGVTADMTSVTILWSNSYSSNVRLDDIVLKGSVANVPITSIAFTEPKTASVGVGGTVTLTPTVLPAIHTEAVDWESDATGVATVNSAGVVTGVAAGTAHITAKAHDNPSTIYDVCTVTVTAAVPVTGVSLNKTSTTLLLGGTETLTAAVAPLDATNKNVTWTSADGTKVSVENGVITALALTGVSPVNITVTTEDGGFSATCAVTVNPVPVASVSLDKTSATLVAGKTLTLSETVLPDNATDKSVTWESDDTDVATVTDAGFVTAVAAGTATITVKSVADPTKKAECTITVTDGSIDLRTTGAITFGDPFTGEEIGSGGYKTQNCELNGSDGNTYTWAEINGYFNDGGWQIRNSTGKVTSPVIKSEYGFTISTTKKTNNVTISDGTTSSQNSLTTTKTSTTITIVGDGGYAVFTKITITPLKAPVATDVVITGPGELAIGAEGTFAYTATTEEANTASWTSATPSVITITDASTGEYTAAGRGTSKITLTLTPDDAATYDAVTAQSTITVTAPVVVTASDVAMTYGDAAKAIGATTSAGYEGTLTYTSGNTSIATVDASGNVTAVAVGTTTITISAPADAENYYTAGEDVVIDVTVSAPAGGTTAKTTTPATVVSQTLLSSSLPANWTGDGAIWSGSNSYGAVATSGEDGSTYDLKTESINLIGNYSAASVTFEHTGNKTFSTPSNACKLYVKDGETETQLTINTYFTGSNWTYVSNNSDLSAYIGKSIQLIFRYTPVSGDNGKWQVKNFSVSATPSPTESVTLNASGYATFCSLYPLDFTDYATAGYSAWEVTDISESAEVYTVTFNHLTGTIKGGQGILLKGTAGETVTINSCNSENTLGDNLLEGTTAPTYVTSGDYYGLSGKNFVPVNTGTVKAGKALLDADWIPDPSLVKSFTFVFNDTATGITETRQATREEVEAIFNLGGQRMSKMQRGINIVNGKKVLVK